MVRLGVGETNYKLKTAPARLLDCTGWTTTSEIPKPTVSPIATEMSCRAVWKPDKYDVDDPEFDRSANDSRPPLPSPLGSWKRIPVICISAKHGRSMNRGEIQRRDLP